MLGTTHISGNLYYPSLGVTRSLVCWRTLVCFADVGNSGAADIWESCVAEEDLPDVDVKPAIL